MEEKKAELVAFPREKEDYDLFLDECYTNGIYGIQVGKLKIMKIDNEEPPVYKLELSMGWLDFMVDILKNFYTVRDLVEGLADELPPETTPSFN